ncbi:MAG TPA: hypothetical protein VGK02_05520 [Candidatus Aquicultor sp.]|jgi:hypothetical protein
MSIRPTDLQIIVQKTQEVERISQAQQQQPRIQQEQVAEKLHQKHEMDKKQINTAPHTDEVQIHDKERDGRQSQEHHTKHEGSGAGTEHDKEHSTHSTLEPEHFIDIKI